jgi:DNA-binding NarL/FixJ family response regulator
VVHAPDPISREGAISQLRRHRVVEVADEWDGREPGVAVLLVESVDEDTLGWVRRIVRGQGLRAVLVANAIREAELFDVIACGIGAVVWRREATGDRLVQAVRAAARGGGDLPPDLLGLLVKQVNALRPGTALAAGGGLTAREMEVLRLCAEGLDTGEVAVRLSYSERTVKNVLQGLTTRLGLRNRVHAVAYALREGYIS